MPEIVLARELQHEQVEFPDEVERPKDRRGSSLHLQRGKVRDVTDAELAFIKKNRPEVYRCLDVLSKPSVHPVTAKRFAALAKDKKTAEKMKSARQRKSEASRTKEAPKPEVRKAAPAKEKELPKLEAKKPEPETKLKKPSK